MQTRGRRELIICNAEADAGDNHITHAAGLIYGSECSTLFPVPLAFTLLLFSCERISWVDGKRAGPTILLTVQVCQWKLSNLPPDTSYPITVYSDMWFLTVRVGPLKYLSVAQDWGWGTPLRRWNFNARKTRNDSIVETILIDGTSVKRGVTPCTNETCHQTLTNFRASPWKPETAKWDNCEYGGV